MLRPKAADRDKVAPMKITTMAMILLFATLAVSASQPGLAQNAVGGATKTKQNTVGGVAKPGPVLGGASTPALVSTKPGVVGMTKPNPVTSMPAATSNAASLTGSTAKPNPPATPPNKGGAVATFSNLKCATGACVAKGGKALGN